MPPGRTPRLTISVGGPVLRASASLAGPRPSSAQRSESPTTSKACVSRRVEDRILAGCDQTRLRGNSRRSLDGQGDVGEQAACVASSLIWLGIGSEQLERRVVAGGQPGTDLEGSPVVLVAAEREPRCL